MLVQCAECPREVPEGELVCCECGACICADCFGSEAHNDCGEDTPIYQELEPSPSIDVRIGWDKIRIAGE